MFVTKQRDIFERPEIWPACGDRRRGAARRTAGRPRPHSSHRRRHRSTVTAGLSPLDCHRWSVTGPSPLDCHRWTVTAGLSPDRHRWTVTGPSPCCHRTVTVLSPDRHRWTVTGPSPRCHRTVTERRRNEDTQSMKWIELKIFIPVQIHDPLILIQSNPAEDPEAESSPDQCGHNRVGILQIPCKVYM